MADFTRLALFTIAENAGWKRGKPITRPLRIAIRSELLKALRTTDGKRALEEAPRVHYAERGVSRFIEMSEADAVDALIEELEGAT